MQELVTESLSIVGEELAVTFEDIRSMLERYAEGGAGPQTIERCLNLLHSVNGVLRMTETYGASLLTEEMEETCRYLEKAQRQGAGADEALEALLRETVAEPALSEILSILEQADDAHPKEPHWHLAFVGCDPAHRGKGIGGTLLAHALADIDENKLHAYLESSNPRNVPLYERHGFEVLHEIRVGTSPPVFPMVRRPR